MNGASDEESRRKICYFYDDEVGNYYYGQGHPMKPHRIRMTHNLLLNYGLYKKMTIIRPKRISEKEMTKFHSDEYVNFLRLVNPDNMNNYSKQLVKFNVGEDCPVFDGLYQFCQISAGGSVGGAVKLNQRECDIAVNWAGGLHHAKKSEASGFCYINDIVLAILELLKFHSRVLYIDIDIHHGDGVEEAFYTTDRVMCVSFHKFGEYFPGTGHIRDIGASKGKYYSLNFPLRDGIDDESYESIFKPIIGKVMEVYRPDAVVMQCGADSLAGDRLGCFNLSLKGHANCVDFVKSFNIPMLVLGGGGYTIRNVARCWTYETSILLGSQLEDELPYNDYLEYFGPEYRLHITPSNMENLNTSDYLENCKITILDNLRHLEPVPSVQMQPLQSSMYFPMNDQHDEQDPDVRISMRDRDRRIVPNNELSDSDDEDDRRDFTMEREPKGILSDPIIPPIRELQNQPKIVPSITIPYDHRSVSLLHEPEAMSIDEDSREMHPSMTHNFPMGIQLNPPFASFQPGIRQVPHMIVPPPIINPPMHVGILPTPHFQETSSIDKSASPSSNNSNAPSSPSANSAAPASAEKPESAPQTESSASPPPQSA